MTATETAMATWWVTERRQQLASRCPQLHGGYGYMTESPLARDFVGSRVGTPFAGTTEVIRRPSAGLSLADAP
ncbi:acyl-CoA dehydrogenase family protein [Streptomyces sp. ID05-47C]|nr:acyl-CoA dehydrogenase family protein [Streptomyces sp. ID05-47C]